MNLLGATLYDPAGAVTKNTTALLAMTALDTTNLRLTVTVPSHGMLYIRLTCIVHGATTFPSILLGVLNGSTVVGRVSPSQRLGNTAVATARVHCEAAFVVPGLTPGSITLDAAYGVEVVIAATGIKYGGPNDTTINNAFGGFGFEIWDPQPQTTTGQLSVDANGRVDVIKVAGTTQTARDLGANIDATVSSRLASASYTAPLDAVGTRTAVGLASANLDTQLDALPTNSELTTALASADDATLAAIAALDVLTEADVRTAVGLATADLDTQLGEIATATAPRIRIR